RARRRNHARCVAGRLYLAGHQRLHFRYRDRPRDLDRDDRQHPSRAAARRRPRMSEAIRSEKVVKTFGKITALAGVSLEVAWGEKLGILGDNGAGKSTLIKILTGYHQPDSGQVFVDGRPVELASVDGARALGIECVYQDLAL